MAQQVKSRERVVEHGEVFTNEREVNAMLDMVAQECERIDSRFLEPACGNGNFIAEVLRRKLAVVRSRYRKSPSEYQRYAFVAVASIYGVELLEDNVAECRERLLGIAEAEAAGALGAARVEPAFTRAVSYVLSQNICCGDALTMTRADGGPIVFAEWSMVSGDLVKRRDYRFDELLGGHERQLSLFQQDWEYDAEADAFLPSAVADYAPCDWREVGRRG